MKRGYLGALGDDFPAIFPLAMGLMLFFGAITMSYDFYDTKQQETSLMRANLALAKAVRSQLRFNEDQFWGSGDRNTPDESTACDALMKTKTNYGVRAQMSLVRFEKFPGEKFGFVKFKQGASTSTEEQVVEDKYFNLAEGDPEGWSGTDARIAICGDDEPKQGTPIIRMTYPVLTEVEHTNAPKETVLTVLVMKTW